MNRISGAKMIKLEQREQICLFKEPTDSVIISILEGKKGNVWTDENKVQAFAFDGIYGYFDGQITKKFVMEALYVADELKSVDNVTIVPQNEISEKVLVQALDEYKQIKYEKKSRYLMREPVEGFNRELLQGYTASLPENMRIEGFDEIYFNQMKNDTTLEYLTESYKDYDEFKNVGVGFLITEKVNIVAGAVSYSVFSEGIEVQLMTVPEYRGKGLAGIVVARLLLYCAENSLRAIWDAANLTSVSIANKMGYVLKRQYNAYTLYGSPTDEYAGHQSGD